MALDHYVSQVHLKQFNSPKLGELMYAIRKSDLKDFTPNSKSVCRIDNHSTNTYLSEPRIIEEFLKDIEPRYNSAIEKIKIKKMDRECVYIIAGFTAFVQTCSPAGMRINSTPFKEAFEETGRILDALNKFPPPPKELGAENLTELLERGDALADVDQKYPQAVGISSIVSLTSRLGNSYWEILVNPFKDSPFFTSDFPVAIEKTGDPRVLNKIIPLTPNLAIRICPDINADRNNIDFSFRGFRYNYKKLMRKEVQNINRILVRCAEELVFYNHRHNWIPRFVRKNANYRIEPKCHRLPEERGTYLIFTQEVCQMRK